jgi:hypothetical protein
MIETLPAPDHVAAYRFSGTIDEADFDHVIADVEARLARHTRIGVLADLTGFEGMTVMAGMKDARYGLGKILQWHRFKREAVVTDKGWIETLVAVANPIIPGVEIRCFKPAVFDAALAWAGEIEGGPDV